MRMLDLRCGKCERVVLDHLERDEDKQRPDCCGEPMERVHLPTQRGTVIGDSIPGGLWIKNGICNADGTPKRYDSWTDIRKAEKVTGWVNRVRHIGTKGGDRSKHTTRWT